MRLATISHSHIALRQQLFFQEVARQGHQVLVVSPGEWGNQRVQPYQEDSFRLAICRHMGGEGVYDYTLLGAQEAVGNFNPDWLYIQAEPGSAQEEACFSWNVKRKALFTWENISLKGGLERLPEYDLVVCGNPAAEALVKPHNPRTTLILQVGVDTDHFQARPGIPRDIRVGYIGRRTPEKGLPYLISAWPTAQILDWKDYRDLPWYYSQVQVLVAYSQDVPGWREQAPNYVVLESLSCGCKAAVSTTAAMSYWLRGCPGVVFASGHEQRDQLVDPVKVANLKAAIQEALGPFPQGDQGQQFVVHNFSNPVIARKLLEVLDA